MKNVFIKALMAVLVLALCLAPLSGVSADLVGTGKYGLNIIPQKSETDTTPVLGGTYRVERTSSVDAAGVATPISPAELIGVFTLQEINVGNPFNGFRSNLTGIYTITPLTRAPGYLLGLPFNVEFPRMVCNDTVLPVDPAPCETGYVVAPDEAQVVDAYPKAIPFIGDYTLTKFQGDGTTPLAGVVFELWQNTSVILPLPDPMVPVFMGYFITGANGQINLTNLPEGTYSLYERSVPAGYILDPRPINFDITGPADAGTNPAPQAGTMSNHLPPAITKDVMVEADEHWEDNIGHVYQYHINVQVPTNIASYTAFSVYDIIDSRITLSPDCASAVTSVPAGTLACSKVAADATLEQGERDRFDIAYNPATLVGGSTITITINAFINNTYDPTNPRPGDEMIGDPAAWSGYIPNTATLEWNDGVPNPDPRTGNPGEPGYPGNPGLPPTNPNYPPTNPPSFPPGAPVDEPPLVTPPVWVKPT